MNSEHSELAKALTGFGEESILYCDGINDELARQYAFEYARMLKGRITGLDSEQPRIHHGLFAPSRRLISTTLDGIYAKYFSKRRI
jgi:hypothetical protein